MKSQTEISAKQLESELQKGILIWYEFKESSNVLVIGKRQPLIDMLQQKKCIVHTTSDVESVSSKFLKIGKNFYDYIIVIEEIEKIEEPSEVMALWKGLLKKDGILLLGTDNRLGIRYFCGDRDPYTKHNFDGIENYARYDLEAIKWNGGRCYSKNEIQDMLKKAGYEKCKMYSVFPNLNAAQLIYAEGYLPNEELSMRYIPMYQYPDTVYLQEGLIYNSLIKNGMFHVMANSFLLECTMAGNVSNIKHVTLSMDRGYNQAMITSITEENEVRKQPAYPEGKIKIEKLLENERYLRKRGLSLVQSEVKNGIYTMPYENAKVGNAYLQELLILDKEKFISAMDRFRELILNSSDHLEINEYGIILKRGYIDLVPHNCFYLNDTFIFYDQEFYFENYPANVIIFRTLLIVYDNDIKRKKILPIEFFYERYGLSGMLDFLMSKTVEFTNKLRNQHVLQGYNDKHQCNPWVLDENRKKMNQVGMYEDRYIKTCFEVFKEKKIYLFGSGRYADRFLAFYREELDIECILDNDASKWGQQIYGINVLSPDIIKNLKPQEYKVIICIKKYEPVIRQLKRLGVQDIGVYDAQYIYPGRQKIILPMHLERERKKYHIGYVSGVFDLFHIGHINMLRKAKEQCDYLIAAVTSDEYVRNHKQRDPFIPFEERLEVVRSCKYVDEAVEVPYKYAGTVEAFRKYHFDVQFCGSDYLNDPWWLEQQKYLRQHGADLVFFQYTEQTSSTKIKALIAQKLL